MLAFPLEGLRPLVQGILDPSITCVSNYGVLYNNYLSDIAPEWFGIDAAASEYRHPQRYWANSDEQRVRIRTEETQSRPSSCQTTIGELSTLSWIAMKALLLKYCNWRVKLALQNLPSFMRQFVLDNYLRKWCEILCQKFPKWFEYSRTCFGHQPKLDEYYSTCAPTSTICCNPVSRSIRIYYWFDNDLCFHITSQR